MSTLNLDNWKKLDVSKIPETPFYLYDIAVLEQVWAEFQNHSKTIPEYRVYFSMKSNNNPMLLNFFKEKGCGIDVVSKWELLRALEIGFSPKDIVFSGAGKSTSELEVAVSHQIKMINVESEDEFYRLEKVVNKLQQKVTIGFRVNPDVDAATHPYIATGLRTHKFGVDFETAIDLYKIALQKNRFIECKGISVHIGSQIQDVDSFREAFFKVKTLIDRLKANGASIEFFDLGGGLGIDYSQPTRVADFQNYFRVVSELQKSLSGKIHLASELGRALIAHCGMLVTRVIGQKFNGEKTFLFVDASMTELLRPALYQARHPVSLWNKTHHDSRNSVFEIVGPVCESSDVFGADYELPSNLEENDLLSFQLAGAYGQVMSSQYNLRPAPREYILDNNFNLLLNKTDRA